MNSSFPFLDLPSEIRIHVYEWAVLMPQRNKIGPSYEESKQLKDIPGYGHGPYAEPAITRVTKSIRAESIPVFYRLRRFPLLTSPVHTTRTRRIQGRIPKPHPWINNVDTTSIRLMKSFALELLIPHHRDSDETVRCILSVDFKSSSYDIWLGTSWGDNRFMPLDRYWNRVMTREDAGVGPVIARLSAVLSSMDGLVTHDGVCRLTQAALGE